MATRLELAVDCVVEAGNTVGESPVWSAAEDALYWVDIPAGTLFRWRPGEATPRTWRLDAAIGSFGFRERGGMVLAMRSGFHLFDPDTGRLEFLVHPEPEIPTNRLNDGKVSPDGRFFAGTMDDRPARQRTGHLYRLDPDHTCRRVASDLAVSNGLAWSPDGRTLYHSDSRAPAIYRYAYDSATGALGPREIFVTPRPEWGRPDGGAADVEGCYWSCGIGAGRLNRFAPDGELVSWVELPVTHPTMPCFGGPGLRTLYVTSLREHVPPEDLARAPLAGGLFRLDPGVAGVPIARYRG